MKIVCLGDSLTAGYKVRRENAWVSILDRETPHTWINAGISGDTSVGMLVRLQTQVLPRKPDVVFWMGGSNDIIITGSADQAKNSLMAMIHQCGQWGVTPVIGIPLSMRSMPERWKAVCDTPVVYRASEGYVRWLRMFLNGIPQHYVDFDAACRAVGNGPELYLEDGLHPSELGQRVMADAVLAQLKLNG